MIGSHAALQAPARAIGPASPVIVAGVGDVIEIKKQSGSWMFRSVEESKSSRDYIIYSALMSYPLSKEEAKAVKEHTGGA